jgi:hypothetical protein
VLAESAVGQNGLGRHEIVRVEPRGRTDLRVRGAGLGFARSILVSARRPDPLSAIRPAAQ